MLVDFCLYSLIKTIKIFKYRVLRLYDLLYIYNIWNWKNYSGYGIHSRLLSGCIEYSHVCLNFFFSYNSFCLCFYNSTYNNYYNCCQMILISLCIFEGELIVCMNCSEHIFHIKRFLTL